MLDVMLYNRTSDKTRAQIVASLVEGTGVRATARIVGCAINTVQAVVRDVGPRCRRNHDEMVRNLSTTRVQADEMWGFCFCREGRIPKDRKGEFGIGDVWMWSAIDANTRLVVSYMVGRRQRTDAYSFLRDLRDRLRHRVQLDTDAHNAYWSAMGVFNPDGTDDPGIDYARVVKHFQDDQPRYLDGGEQRYRHSKVTSITRQRICGDPDVASASTSYAERLNLAVRTSNARLQRATIKHSKKVQMLGYSLDLWSAWYNFVKPHESLGGRTPAMAEGITDHRWTTLDLVTLPEADPVGNPTVPRV